MTDSVFARHKLANGLTLIFKNEGNRYFGDYHQVKVVVSCRIDLNESLLSRYLSAEDLGKARQLFGECVEYKRLLKQMGVAGDDVDMVLESMVKNYMGNAAIYMQGKDFASRYVARRLADHMKRSNARVGYD